MTIWTKERIDILKKYYPISSNEEIMNLTGIFNMQCIVGKAYKLKIKKDIFFFSDEDILFIENNIDKMSYKEIAKKLGRTECSIGTKINKLGIRKTQDWTEEDLDLLKIVYPKHSNKYLSEKYFPSRSPENIRGYALKNGLHKNNFKGTKWYSKEEMIEKLIKVSKKIKRTPLGKELCSLGLPSAKTYERRFGSYIYACEIAGLMPNSSLFGKSVFCYSKNNDLCFSDSEKIITNFFIKNNISYKKEEFYKDYCKDKQCKEKRVDWVINNNIFVEYFGMPEKEDYFERMTIKRNICKKNNILLIELFRKDLKKLHEIFKSYKP
jgi:hypothetical protein